MYQDLSPLIISLKTSVTATIIAFILGIYAARLVRKCDKKWVGILDSLFTLPMILPPTVVGFFLLVLFGKNGVIGSILIHFGIQLIFSWSSTVIAAAVVAFPLVYRTLRGSFEQIDDNIIFAARTLGMSEGAIFWKIILPICWPGMAAGSILAFARALGEFGATMMIAGNIPGKTQTMPLAVFFAVESGNMKLAGLWVSLLIIVSLICMLLINYWNQIQKSFGKVIRRRK